MDLILYIEIELTTENIFYNILKKSNYYQDVTARTQGR